MLVLTKFSLHIQCVSGSTVSFVYIFLFNIAFRKRYTFPLIDVIQRQWNGKLVILMKYFSLSALEVVRRFWTMSSAASDKNLVKWQHSHFSVASRYWRCFFTCNQLWNLPIYLQFKAPCLVSACQFKTSDMSDYTNLGYHLWQMCVS